MVGPSVILPLTKCLLSHFIPVKLPRVISEDGVEDERIAREEPGSHVQHGRHEADGVEKDAMAQRDAFAET